MSGEDKGFSSLLEAIPDAVLIVDDRGVINTANGQAVSLFGYSVTELVQSKIELLIPQRFHTQHVEERTRFMGAPQARAMGTGLALFGRHKSGREFPVDIMLGPLEMDSNRMVMAVVRDITERKQNEEALQRSHAELEERVKERTAQLAQANEEMERAVHQRTLELQQRTRIIELASDAIIIRGLENDTIRYWNLGAEHLYGWTAQETTGKNIHQFLKTVFPKPFDEMRTDFLKRGRWEGELTHTCRDGRLITVFSRWTLERNELGEATGFLEINTDITEQKRLDSARQQLEDQIHQNAGRAEALAELSKIFAENTQEEQHLFDLVSHRIAELLGDLCVVTTLSPDQEWLATKAFASRNPDGQTYLQQNMPAATRTAEGGYAGHVAQTGEAIHLVNMAPAETRAQITTSYVGYVDRFGVTSLLIVPLRARGQILGTLGVARGKGEPPYDADDLTFLQEVADRAGLAIESARLYVAARVAQMAADEANLAKSEFLSRMSHELRTPLNAVLGFAQLMEMDQHTPRQAEGLAQILRAGKHLLGLINEVLDLTRIETGKLSISPEPVNASEVVAEALDLVLAQAAKQLIQIETSIRESDFVKADRQRLKQAILNLLSNAIKYNRVGGKVWVTVTPQPGQQLRIEVRDTGQGIRAEYMKRLFIPFDRLGAEQGDVEGTGLGLAVSQRLVEAMQGKLGVESQVNEGSTFWIQLPAVTSPAEYAAQSGLPKMAEVDYSQAPRQPSKLVLYIEDNLSNLQLIQQVFDFRASIKLISAANGESGLRVAKRNHPDLILLDLHLPDITGSEVLQRLQADPETSTIPVVIVSADATAHQLERLQAAGARAYLSKPLNIPEFLRVVDEILGLGISGPRL